jgi:thiamine monophosphate kinase
MKINKHLFFVALIISLTSVKLVAQYNTVKYVSNGYFTGMDFSDSLMVEAEMVITISQNRVEILKIDLSDPSKDEMFYESRCLSPLKYPAADGEFFYVWKLGDRKMVLRIYKGTRYLSLYQTDEYGLPGEYLTFKIRE